MTQESAGRDPTSQIGDNLFEHQNNESNIL